MTDAVQESPIGDSPWRHHFRVAGIVAAVLAALAGIAAALLAGFLAIIFHVPPPPVEVVDAQTSAEEQLRAVDGVTAVTSEVGPRDLKDGGPLDEADAWIVRLGVSIAPGRLDLPLIIGVIDTEVGALADVVPATGTVRIAAASGAPSMILGFSGGASLREIPLSGSPESSFEIALAASAVPHVRAIDVGTGTGTNLGIDSLDHLADAVVASSVLTRPEPSSLSSITLYRTRSAGAIAVSVSVGAGPGSPSPELVGVLVSMAELDGVTGVSLDAARIGYDTTVPWRPSLAVEVSTPSEVAPTAEALASIDVAIVGTPRPSFTVRAFATSGKDSREGYLGSALGAPEPTDAIAPDAPPAPPVVDPVVEEARIQASLTLVESILREAGSAVGSEASDLPETISCPSGVGRQVIGSAVLPVDEQSASQQDSFDAIVAAWTARGFRHTGKATGTDLYSGTGLARLTIVGRSDGISIHVESVCSEG